MAEIKNLDKASNRIKQAVENNEKIILYGDSDLDGIASVVILEEAIKNIGVQITTAFFPNRELDGYGINLKALEILKELSPALLITLDLGIGNVKEVEIANKMGFEVIIIDHHEILETIPNAQIVVDPKQKGSTSNYEYLCNAGLTFKLAEEMLGNNMSPAIKNSLLELTALATISDMVPQIEDNIIFIDEGLKSLENTFRPGLKALINILDSPSESLRIKLWENKGNIIGATSGRIISTLNAGESDSNGKNESYNLLISSSYEEYCEIAENLVNKIKFKQQKIKEIAEEVERRIKASEDETIIFEGDPAWKLTLAGPVASIIASKYGKPTFIYKKMDTESCGSVRSLKEGENSVDAMKSCSDILMTYGGHPKASGFRIKNENLEEFKERLIKYFKR